MQISKADHTWILLNIVTYIVYFVWEKFESNSIQKFNIFRNSRSFPHKNIPGQFSPNPGGGGVLIKWTSSRLFRIMLCSLENQVYIGVSWTKNFPPGGFTVTAMSKGYRDDYDRLSIKNNQHALSISSKAYLFKDNTFKLSICDQPCLASYCPLSLTVTVTSWPKETRKLPTIHHKRLQKAPKPP